MIFKFIDKYRQEAWHDYHNRISETPTWRQALLESIFRPSLVVPGKTPMSHLHPRIKELNLPKGMYIADWRKYQVEDHPILVNYQKRCHAMGLHDPWLRNYAHQFYDNNVMARSRMRALTEGFSVGFLIGLGLYLTRITYRHFYPLEVGHTEKYYEKHHDHHE